MILEQKNVCIFDFFFLYNKILFTFLVKFTFDIDKETKIVNKYINIIVS